MSFYSIIDITIIIVITETEVEYDTIRPEDHLCQFLDWYLEPCCRNTQRPQPAKFGFPPCTFLLFETLKGFWVKHFSTHFTGKGVLWKLRTQIIKLIQIKVHTSFRTHWLPWIDCWLLANFDPKGTKSVI